MDSSSFAFIAGGEEDPPVVHASLTLEAISLLLNWRTVSDFECVVDYYSLHGTQEFTLSATPSTGGYVGVNTDSGQVSSYDPSSGLRVVNGMPQDPPTLTQYDYVPVVARLLFPLSLGIWGRPMDSWAIKETLDMGDELLVLVRNRLEPRLIGSLTVDRNRRQALQFDSPGEIIHYRDISRT